MLAENNQPILVLERTVEVPSGHNVGQRFARLVAAAQLHVPTVYFGPYVAYKHGGATQGPRWMNLRLFHALNDLGYIEGSAVTTIRWPVDEAYEIIQDPAIRDKRVKEYLDLFLNLYSLYGVPGMTGPLASSAFQNEQLAEQLDFAADEVKNPEQYDAPPDSVWIGPWKSMASLLSEEPRNLTTEETVVYRVGMTYVRSDPYAGMAMLYSYLYCGGMKTRTRNLVLHFPQISMTQWVQAASRGDRKDVRLFRLAGDGLLLSDGYLPRGRF